MDPELRDLKVEWKDCGMGVRLLFVEQTHGDNSVTELWLTARQAEQVAKIALTTA